jgi:hypothetical protein
MCEWACRTYASCQRNPKHEIRYQINRCQTAAQNNVPCIPASGHQRDLLLARDIQDTNITGDCPVCEGNTPANSSD